ncbi:DUF2170 domain-containing protein [Vreelandella rituensis]|uniref:DUF2170 family protein n=1 Tax=Vreelandella rituensis TaxID=2282306 RepID=A0A368U8R7_9GAMM|nr:DUF2170 family protein [Halomonas rituensis]RCV93578.1 DUF2170 family protein [Halomonas rituensis]
MSDSTTQVLTPDELKNRLVAVFDSVVNVQHEWPECGIWLDLENASVALQMHDYGDLSVTVTLSDSGWLVMTEVAPVSAVHNTAELNETLLRLGMMLPLVSIGIADIAGESHYVIYGQLFPDCKLEALSAEVQACADAALDVAGLLQEQQAA